MTLLIINISFHLLRYYSPTILKMAGASDNHIAIGLSAVIAFGNFIFTLLGIYFVEKSGRRKLILASLAGVIFSLLVLSIAFYFTNSTTQSACPTDKCLQDNCNDCVIEDNCFYCLFPFNGTYRETGTTGFCISRDWTDRFEERSDSCWVPDAILHLDRYNSSCANTSYTLSDSFGPPNSSYYYGVRYSSCPNQFQWLALIAMVMYIVSFSPGSSCLKSNSVVFKVHSCSL